MAGDIVFWTLAAGIGYVVFLGAVLMAGGSSAAARYPFILRLLPLSKRERISARRLRAYILRQEARDLLESARYLRHAYLKREEWAKAEDTQRVMEDAARYVERCEEAYSRLDEEMEAWELETEYRRLLRRQGSGGGEGNQP